ncbi:hypothetical protein QE152_g12665 [Popillia japonica]|uniref:Uncharacterized protein n=1 Tax=Popillia japonica TaxID=7064 RepID=A0AAW1LIA0_POPJA
MIYLFKFLTTAELIEMAKNEKFWENVESMDVFITPPVDGNESEGDSADENGKGDVNHLSGRQLQVETVAPLYSNAGVTHLGQEIDVEKHNISLSELQRTIKQKLGNIRRC